MSIPGGRDPADQNVENPGAWLRRFELSERVVSCEEAADAKGVPLHHELKSLLLICDHGYALAHLHGDRRLSLRAVKDAMGTRQARLAAQSEAPPTRPLIQGRSSRFTSGCGISRSCSSANCFCFPG